MQFHRVLQDKAEDVEPSVCNSTPVEHGSEEDAESPAEDGKTKPGNTPGLPVQWPRNSIVTTIAVIEARDSKLAAIKIDGFTSGVHDTAVVWPRIVSVIVCHPKSRCVLLPVQGPMHPAALVLEHEIIPCLCDPFSHLFVIVIVCI